MADTKISGLTHATVPLIGTELLALSDGTTVSKYASLAELLTNDKHAGYSEYADIANPATPTTGLRLYGRSIAGRMMLKWIPPSGVDNPVQPALFGNTIVLWTPMSGTTATGGFGTLWAKGGGLGTVSTPTLASTNFISAMRRMRHANVITTTNQAMGIIATAAGIPQFWRGNAGVLGGFFFAARFGLGLWAAGSRLFVGLTAGAAEVVTSDTIANNSVGLSRLSTDTANTLSFVTRNATATTTVAVPGATVAANSCFDVFIYAKPNDTTISYRVDQIDSGAPVTLIDSSATATLPLNTVFLGPQVEASNGTANITANTVAIDVNRIYCESDN